MSEKKWTEAQDPKRYSDNDSVNEIAKHWMKSEAGGELNFSRRMREMQKELIRYHFASMSEEARFRAKMTIAYLKGLG